MSEAAQVLKYRDVIARTGLSRSSIHYKLTPGGKRANLFDPTFPTPLALGPRRVGFLASEVDAWIQRQAAARQIQGAGQ